MTPSEDRVLNKLREEIARIIEPFYWRWLDVPGQEHAYAPGRQETLAKADQIIAAWKGGASREPAQATQVSSDPTANADHDRALSFVRQWLSEPLDPDQHPEWLNLARAYAETHRAMEALQELCGVDGDVMRGMLLGRATLSRSKAVRMLVDQDWLSRHVATDPDVPVEASPHPDTSRHVDGAGWEPFSLADERFLDPGAEVLVRFKVTRGAQNDYRGLYYILGDDPLEDPTEGTAEDRQPPILTTRIVAIRREGKSHG